MFFSSVIEPHHRQVSLFGLNLDVSNLLYYNTHYISFLTIITFSFSVSFKMIDSEDCESKGMRMVATKKECEDAAVFLKLTDTSADELLQNEDLAPGCIYQNNRWLAWASLKNHSDPNKPCGKSQWVVLHKLLIASSCICASRSGKPYNSTALKQLNHRLQ